MWVKSHKAIVNPVQIAKKKQKYISSMRQNHMNSKELYLRWLPIQAGGGKNRENKPLQHQKSV